MREEMTFVYMILCSYVSMLSAHIYTHISICICIFALIHLKNGY